MLKSMQVSWLRSIPMIVVQLFSFLVVLICGNIYKMFRYDRKLSWAMYGYCVVTLLYLFCSPSYNIFGFLSILINSAIIISVIFLKDVHKLELFDWFAKAVSLILVITIPAWFLYLLGVDFPHGPVVDIGDGFHFLYDYGFFVRSADVVSEFPRFSSVFLEPGWVGTVCSFLLFGLKLNLKRVETWLCLTAILLSLSLSAYMNVFICYLLWLILMKRYRIVNLSIATLFFICISSYAIVFNRGDNAIKTMIVNRLAFDEDLGIVGNNRTNDTFGSYFDRTMASSDRWFGKMHTYSKDFVINNDWYNHSSGIKKDLFDNGIIGTSFFILFLLFIFRRYFDKMCLVYLICLFLASFIRNLWRTDCYIILYIVALSTLYATKTDNSIKNIINRNARLTKK